MHITELTALTVRLPLRRQVKHASAERRESENVLVRCRLADGTLGWGEGVPRSYVTGETAAGALEQLARTPLAEQLSGSCNSWQEVFDLCEQFQPPAVAGDERGCRSNALRCAVELSLLDAYGRLLGEPLSAAVRAFPPAQDLWQPRARVRYSGVITAESPRAELLSAVKMRAYGFAQCKVKVGLPGVDERARLARLRRAVGARMDLRLDANEAWRAEQVVAHMEPLVRYRITALEQPVPHAEVAALAEVRQQLPVPIMLDESLTSQFDAERAIELGACDLFNIRLSKCGGFLNSLRLAARAREAGLGYQLGCHPGESAILSAAGRHWSAAVGAVRYLEGSYDRHLLKVLLTREDITFGYGGWAPALRGPGLGVTIDPAALAEVQTSEQSYRI